MIRRRKSFDINMALFQLKEYAFDELKCVYVQITDKEIEPRDLNGAIKFYETDILVKDISGTQEDVLNSFSKQAKRYVRQFNDRETVETVAFDENFVDVYYPQLIDVFARQNLKPTFSREKIYKLAEAFKEYPQMVLAQKSITSDGICNGTALTFGKGKWCYYLCAANTRETANAHPGEGLFWEMTKHWNNSGIYMMDLVGVRDYKMRYNPVLKKAVTVYFERVPGLYKGKLMAKYATQVMRKCRGGY